jgi:hypothetical protein
VSILSHSSVASIAGSLCSQPAPSKQKGGWKFPVFQAIKNLSVPHNSPPSSVPPAPAKQTHRGSITGLLNHFQKGPTPPTTTANSKDHHNGATESTVDTFDHEEDGEDNDDLLALETEKSRALEACIEQLLQELRHAGSPNRGLYGSSSSRHQGSSWKSGAESSNKEKLEECFAAINVYQKLFSAPFSAYSLRGQICLSALPADKRAALSKAVSVGTSANTQSKVQEWFHRKGQDIRRSDTLKRVATVLEKGSTAVLGEELSAQLLNQLLLTGDQLDGDINRVQDPKVSVIIHDVKLSNLFYLRWYKVPRVYMIYRVNRVACRTASKDSIEGNVDWCDDAAKILKIEELTSSQMELEFDVLYEGILGDTLVTSAKIAFNPYDPPSYTDKEISFETFFKDSSASAENARNEGRSMPKLTASVRIVSNLM